MATEPTNRHTYRHKADAGRQLRGKYAKLERCEICNDVLGDGTLDDGQWTFGGGGEIICFACAAEPENGAERGYEQFAQYRRPQVQG